MRRTSRSFDFSASWQNRPGLHRSQVSLKFVHQQFERVILKILGLALNTRKKKHPRQVPASQMLLRAGHERLWGRDRRVDGSVDGTSLLFDQKISTDVSGPFLALDFTNVLASLVTSHPRELLVGVLV